MRSPITQVNQFIVQMTTIQLSHCQYFRFQINLKREEFRLAIDFHIVVMHNGATFMRSFANIEIAQLKQNVKSPPL